MATTYADGLGRHPAYDEVRFMSTVKARLGVKEQKGDTEYPREHDYFGLSVQDGATDEILAAYGPRPKRLRVMLPVEAPLKDHPAETDDLVLSIYNTAWGWKSGLLCKGTGKSKDQPGLAETTEPVYADRIGGQTGLKWEPAPGGRLRGVCHGVDCIKYRLQHEVPKEDGRGKVKTVLKMAPGHDPDAPCKLSVVFKALLLHPKDPNPANILGVLEVASGSINSIAGLVSGFGMMRGFTRQHPNDPGRTALIPIWIFRKHTTTTKGARAVHYTIAIHPTPMEWQRYAKIPTGHMFLPPTVIAELQQLKEASYNLDSFGDIIPRPLELEAGAGADLDQVDAAVHGRRAAPETPTVPQGGQTGGSKDPDEAAAAAPTPHFEFNPELDRELTRDEINSLKDALGGREDPDDSNSPALPEAKQKLVALLNRFNAMNGTSYRRVDELTVRFKRWAFEQVGASEPPDPDDLGDLSAAETVVVDPAAAVAAIDAANASKTPDAGQTAQTGLFDAGHGR